MSVMYDDVQMNQETDTNTKSFENDAVTSKISVTEYHNLIYRQTYGLF